MPAYIDIGLNLCASAFRHDREAVLERARQNGLRAMIITGTDIASSEQAIELCAQLGDDLYSTAGVHPHHAKDYRESTSYRIAELASETCVKAIGECGLDFKRNFSSEKQQRHAFEAQLEVAADVGLPVFLHQRDAHDAFLSMMQRWRPRLAGAVAHCFTGTAEEAKAYIDLDMHIGITGWLCDERRGDSLRDAVTQIPVERIMIETDAPYLMPRDLLKQADNTDAIIDTSLLKKNRNEPCVLPHIAQQLAAIIGYNHATLCDQLLSTSQDFFSL